MAGECGREERPRDDVRRRAGSCPKVTSGDGQGAARDDVRRWARSCPGCRQEMGRNHIPSGFRAKGRRTGFILR